MLCHKITRQLYERHEPVLMLSMGQDKHMRRAYDSVSRPPAKEQKHFQQLNLFHLFHQGLETG